MHFETPLYCVHQVQNFKLPKKKFAIYIFVCFLTAAKPLETKLDVQYYFVFVHLDVLLMKLKRLLIQCNILHHPSDAKSKNASQIIGFFRLFTRINIG